MAETMENRWQRAIIGLSVAILLAMAGSIVAYYQTRLTAVQSALDALKDTQIVSLNAQTADLRTQMATRPTAEEIAKIWRSIADSQRDYAVLSQQVRTNIEQTAHVQAQLDSRQSLR